METHLHASVSHVCECVYRGVREVKWFGSCPIFSSIVKVKITKLIPNLKDVQQQDAKEFSLLLLKKFNSVVKKLRKLLDSTSFIV